MAKWESCISQNSKDQLVVSNGRPCKTIKKQQQRPASAPNPILSIAG